MSAAKEITHQTAEQRVPVEKGVFGAYMQITSQNDGPVTFFLDSSKLF
ncbi:MAG: D-aminoacyl-tRNA deacylase [Sedimentisphaerales bacterium]|jgi:D-Tyr-tRNAtyr deacylase